MSKLTATGHFIMFVNIKLQQNSTLLTTFLNSPKTGIFNDFVLF
jgi:hypothetical protein